MGVAILSLRKPETADRGALVFGSHKGTPHCRRNLQHRQLVTACRQLGLEESVGIPMDPSCGNSENWKQANSMMGLRKKWSGREDLNLRPPGPELGGAELILLVFNHLSGASTVSILLDHLIPRCL
jgi:hypothetical protein